MKIRRRFTKNTIRDGIAPPHKLLRLLLLLTLLTSITLLARTMYVREAVIYVLADFVR